jgi:hypothetical protein
MRTQPFALCSWAGNFCLNLEEVHSPSPWGEILKLQCGVCPTGKSVSIPRPLAAALSVSLLPPFDPSFTFGCDHPSLASAEVDPCGAIDWRWQGRSFSVVRSPFLRPTTAQGIALPLGMGLACRVVNPAPRACMMYGKSRREREAD